MVVCGNRGGGRGGEVVDRGRRDWEVRMAERDFFVDGTESVHFLLEGVDTSLEVLVRLF